MKTSRAFALTELLTVLAIVGVLAAILLPVLGSAKRGAKDSTSLSNLHQLGLACGVYQQEEGAYPASADLLYPNHVRDAGVFASPNDNTPLGYARLLLGKGPRLGTYRGRLTYVGAFEIKRSEGEDNRRLSTPGTTRGLLADLSPLQGEGTLFSLQEGRYHRLTEDLSILSPWFRRLPVKNGTCLLTASFLDDYDDAYLKDACSS